MRRTQLFGSDEHGQVYDYGSKVVRQISPTYFDQVDKLYSLYSKHQLSKIGLVQTTIHRRTMQLHHEKHLISYPHEWTYSMYKDSLIFQLNLVLKLDKYGLTLKDFLPGNVVFSFSRPVFVDFLSLIKHTQLQKEQWLYVGVTTRATSPYKLLFSKMFIPHLLIPLLIYNRRSYAAGRQVLESKACNLGNGRPGWRDVFQNNGQWGFNALASTAKSIWLATFQKSNYLNNIHAYLNLINSMDVVDHASAYLNYYQAKGEDYSLKSRKAWKDKQKNVYQIIHHLKPKTTLDIGANTGWYSLLAENLGSSVIATDLDEGTIDSLYQIAKRSGKKILPLLLPFSAFLNAQGSHAYLSPKVRFSSDLVMCLALIHHLVLGQGLSVEAVIETLSKLSKRAVILEYVDISDEKIQEDPSFFPLISGPASQMYNLNQIVITAKKYFKKVDVLNSTETSRKLLILYH